MLKKANIQWSAKTLKNHVTKGKVLFDCAVQRGHVWDAERKSLLIHSMIEGYPIPALYFAKREDDKYDALDGKQRSEAIRGFLENEYALSSGTPSIINEDGFEESIAGLKFDELSAWAKDAVNDYSLTIYYFDGITDEEISELFFRINNGKPLSSVELTRVRAKSIDRFQIIANHELITESISDAGKKRYNDENVAMQSWVLCFSDICDFTTKNFRPLIENAQVEEEQIEKLNNAMAYVQTLLNRLDIDNKDEKRIVKRIRTRTHLVSCIYLAHKAVEKGIDGYKYGEIVYKFFNSSQTSISSTYNNAVGSGSAKPDKIRSRMAVLDSLLN